MAQPVPVIFSEALNVRNRDPRPLKHIYATGMSEYHVVHARVPSAINICVLFSRATRGLKIVRDDRECFCFSRVICPIARARRGDSYILFCTKRYVLWGLGRLARVVCKLFG